ncbi:MAG: FAD-dependent oxidoreductase [Acidobacteriia bacterium]|nr:FAD-dependent oxidoreductase [Terriglobia bacterium]
MSDGKPSSNGARIGVYVCHCGTNISKTVDVAEVAAAAAKQPGVAVARHYRFMCSDPGQELIQKDIREQGLTRVVVAACSPLMHEPTFRKAVERAGMNRYLFHMANIREQVSWVTLDPTAATGKAKALVNAAVRRVALQQPLEIRRVEIKRRVLVVGGGIAGIEAALQMADAGFEVVLVEREPSIGGHMANFDKTFPTLDCAACILTPKMVAIAQHPNIRLLTYTEVDKVEGFVGNFKVTMRRKPRFVDVSKCNGCGTCYEACPSRPYPTRRRMILAGRVYKEGTPRLLAPADKHVHRVSRTGVPESGGVS